jgi:peptidoglycan/LPS O-acetylase OafA/YrhL
MNLAVNRPLTEVMRDVLADLQDIVRSEIRLAKAEAREHAAKLSSGAKLMGVAAVMGLGAFALLLVAAVQGLATTMPVWLAALIVCAVLGIVAAVLFMSGRQKLKEAVGAEKPQGGA